MRPTPFSASVALLTLSRFALASAVNMSPNATVELVPRQSDISALQCTLQGSLVQCCQEDELLSAVAGIVEPILEALGIALPGLGTIVAFDCQDTVLGLGCTESALCCTLVVPDENIGLNCESVDTLL